MVLAKTGGIIHTIFKTIGFNNLLSLVDDIRHVDLADDRCQLVVFK
jgi:hypothetical protein